MINWLPAPGLALALLSVGLLGCEDSSAPGPSGPSPIQQRVSATAACSEGFTVCDVLDPACQQQIADIAVCQWDETGAGAPMPAISALTLDEYRAEMTAAAPPDEAALAVNTARDDVLTLLGLIKMGELSPEAQVQQNVDGVAAFYDTNTKAITLIDRGPDMDMERANLTLLHEMIHALQDSLHDLASLWGAGEQSTSGYLAVQSLIEGEAELHETVLSARLANVRLTPGVLSEELVRRRALEEAAWFEVDDFVGAQRSVPYRYGALWVFDRWREGGSDAVRQAFSALPVNLLGVLQSGWRRQGANAELMPFPVANVFTPEGQVEGSEQRPIQTDRLGAYAAYATALLAGDTANAQTTGLGWRGDQLDLFRLEAGSAAGRWLVAFDSPPRAALFAQMLSLNPDISVRQNQELVVAVVSANGDKPDWLFGPIPAPN